MINCMNFILLCSTYEVYEKNFKQYTMIAIDELELNVLAIVYLYLWNSIYIWNDKYSVIDVTLWYVDIIHHFSHVMFSKLIVKSVSFFLTWKVEFKLNIGVKMFQFILIMSLPPPPPPKRMISTSLFMFA